MKFLNSQLQHVLYFTIYAVSALFLPPCYAVDGPSQLPMLRIEIGGHSGVITQLAYSDKSKQIVSIAEDKTLRVWQYPELKLLKTIRAPIGQGFEGNLYALAVSPDGLTAAVSGWTAYEWNKSISIYFFDLSSGVMTGAIGGVNEVVNNMRYSPDGQLLYAALANQKGIRVFDAQSLSEVFSDPDYGDNTIGIDFTDEGGFITSSHDSSIRLYGPNFQLLRQQALKFAKQPTAVRYSPDKKHLAVGFMDRAGVLILDPKSLMLKDTLDTSCISQQRNMPRVFWSKSGSRIYAYGTYEGKGNAPLYAWDTIQSGFGPCQRIETSRRNFSAIDVIDEGHIAYGTTDPVVGVFSLRTGQDQHAGKVVSDFRAMGDVFRVSEDGGIVEFASRRDGQSIVRFVVKQRRARFTQRSARALSPAIKSRENMQVENWKYSKKPLLNGQAIQLATHEIVNDIAVMQVNDSVVVGTGWGLIRFDNKGQPLWRAHTSSAVEAVVITGDQGRVLAALADGTVRWYRAGDGVEELALFVDTSDQEASLQWAAWVSEGYYSSSNQGDNLFGWHLNNNADEAAEFFRAVQYERFLFRPDVIDRLFDPGSSDKKNTESATTLLTKLRTSSPGKVIIKLKELNGSVANLDVWAAARNLPIESYAVYLNNIPVLSYGDRKLSARERDHFTKSIQVKLYEKTNNLRVEVFNGKSMATTSLQVVSDKFEKNRPKGDLYLVSIGVNEFTAFARAKEGINLDYPASDAKAFADALIKNGGDVFNQIHSITLSDFSQKKPNRKAIQTALEMLLNAGRDDSVVLFLASHGFSDSQGNYFFIPRDVTPVDLEALVKQGVAGESVLSWEVFFDVLRDTAGQRLLVVDTCQARSISGPLDSHSLAKRSASAQFTLLAASRGNEESQELKELGHGLFTYALLQAINGASDLNNDGIKSISEVFEYAVPIVERLRKKEKPQTPQMITSAPLDQMMLTGSFLGR